MIPSNFWALIHVKKFKQVSPSLDEQEQNADSCCKREGRRKQRYILKRNKNIKIRKVSFTQNYVKGL